MTPVATHYCPCCRAYMRDNGWRCPKGCRNPRVHPHRALICPVHRSPYLDPEEDHDSTR